MLWDCKTKRNLTSPGKTKQVSRIFKTRSDFAFRPRPGQFIEKQSQGSCIFVWMTTKGTWHLQAFLAGFITLATQTVWLRTTFFLFDGNELLTSLYLAVWMLITGAGALLGRRIRSNSRGWILALFVLLGLLPLPFDYLAVLLRNRVFLVGSIPPVHQAAFWLAIWLLPFCLLSGVLFTQLARQVSGNRIYGMEAAGAATGGFMTLIQVLAWPSAQVMHALIPLAAVFGAICYGGKKSIITGVVVFYTIFISGISIFNPLKHATASLYPGQKLLEMRETPQGRLTVTSYYGQSTIFMNGIMHGTSGPAYEPTANIHFSMLYRPQAGKLLVVGGISGHLLSEIALYPALQFTLFEPSAAALPFLIDTSQMIGHEARLLTGDPFPLLKNNRQTFDLVLLNNAPPDNLSLNRFLTVEFFMAIKNRLTPDGLFCCRLPAIAQYGSDETLYLYSIMYNTLGKVYNHVRLIHGPWLWLMASDAPLADNPWQEGNRQAFPEYVNPDYFAADELQRREAHIKGQLFSNAPANTLLGPVAFAAHLKAWIGMTQSRPALVFIPIAIILLLLFRNHHPARRMFVAGYAASAGQVLLLFLLQALLGNIYLLAGMLFGVFMAGLAAGTLLHSHTGLPPRLILALMGLVCLAIPLPYLLSSSLSASGGLTALLILLTAFFLAFLTGSLFSAGISSANASPANLYSSDLAGASAGMLLTGLWLLPAMGLYYTCLFTALVCLAFIFVDGWPVIRKILPNFG